MSEESVQETAVAKLSRAIGSGWSREERNYRMFGRTPAGTYFNQPKDLKHVHDMHMSDTTKRRLYGIGGGSESSVGDVVEARLGTDSRSDLIRELAENTSLTRREAESLVSAWMARNDLVEASDDVLGKIIVPRGSR